MTGLAGLRVGYGGFPLSLIEYLWRAKQPYNVSVAAEVAACAALTNPTYLEVLFHLMTNTKLNSLVTITAILAVFLVTVLQFSNGALFSFSLFPLFWCCSVSLFRM
jgi:histidinol-phosphate/aromatic aminotransferase/cobyric acid decarboxylase-like protein